MNATNNLCPVSDAVAALLPLLTAAEKAALAGSILAAAGVDAEVAAAFIGELSEDDAAQVAAALA